MVVSMSASINPSRVCALSSGAVPASVLQAEVGVWLLHCVRWAELTSPDLSTLQISDLAYINTYIQTGTPAVHCSPMQHCIANCRSRSQDRSVTGHSDDDEVSVVRSAVPPPPPDTRHQQPHEYLVPQLSRVSQVSRILFSGMTVTITARFVC